jgi:hypothetical protein
VADGGLSIFAINGRSPFGLYSYAFAGLEPGTGDPLGYAGKEVSKNYSAIINQSIDTATVIYHGSAIPPYFGNLNNSISHKQLSLSFNISYRFGYYFRKKALTYRELFVSGLTHPDFAKRWQKPGDEAYTTIPSMVYTNYLQFTNRDIFYERSSANVFKGDNIRLEYVRLSYDINKSKLRRLPIQAIQLFLYVNNLGLLWTANDEGLDPDYNTGRAVYPLQKSFAAGVKLDF